MSVFIDRRENPKGKSTGNRQRFIGRVRKTIREQMNKSVREGSISDTGDGEKIIIPKGSTSEPSFRQAQNGGKREGVLPGNKTYEPGDLIEKPPSGSGGGGKEGSDDGEGEDSFAFVLTREEYLEFFFEDLELPDLVEKSLKHSTASKPRRAGFSISGVPANLDPIKTMRNSMGRRIGLKRPNQSEIINVETAIDDLEAKEDKTNKEVNQLRELRDYREYLIKRRQMIAYVDPIDVRYRRFEREPMPETNAVMFCLMDVSASMGEREKDLAKRFFKLLYLFLEREYEKVELVFIRHTHQAQEVDEETFFYSRESGGTVVSTALVEMDRIIKERYSPSEWNIYAAQATDGEDFGNDPPICEKILTDSLMQHCQHFAYIEIISEEESTFLTDEASGDPLWQAYRSVAEKYPQLDMKRVGKRSDIYPVFRQLFEKDRQKAA